MTNNEKFNQMLNNCANPRAMFAALQALFSEPAVKKAENMSEKRQAVMEELAVVKICLPGVPQFCSITIGGTKYINTAYAAR